MKLLFKIVDKPLHKAEELYLAAFSRAYRACTFFQTRSMMGETTYNR